MRDASSTDAGQRYRAGDHVSIPAGQRHALRQSMLNGSAALLTVEQAALLESCGRLRTLDEHAAAYTDTRAKRHAMPQPRSAVQAAIRDELEGLAGRGLLMSESDLRERCFRAARVGEVTPPISTVAVITRDRIDPLRRCLESYIAEGQRIGRSVEYLVVDGAQQAETRDQTRAMLRAMVRTHGVTVRYAGLEETRRFAGVLSDAGVARDAIDLALPADTRPFDRFGLATTYGAQRNVALLATLGRLVLCVDDDTVCRVAAVPGSTTDGLALSSQNDPTSMWFFPDQDRALAAARPADRDIFGIHEEVLGRDVARCLEFAATAEQLGVEYLDAATLRAVESGRARVPVTCTGMHGDAGSGMPPAIRLLDHESRARLTASDDIYRTLALSLHVQRGVTIRTISSSPYLMTIGAGFDNRRILPPFFPVLRGEDTIYGFTLGACLEGARIGHLPFTLEHSPTDRRHVASDAITQFAEHPAWFELVIAAVQSYVPQPGAGAEERIAGLGRHIAEVNSSDFEEYLRLWIWRMKALVMARLTADLEVFEAASKSWGQDVRDYLERLRGSLADRNYLMPPELANTFPMGMGAGKQMNLLIWRFAQLLESWPAMVDAARSLAANGEELAPRLDAR